jgi:hypothetical protein
MVSLGVNRMSMKPPFHGWSRVRKEEFIRKLQGCICGELDLAITFSGVKAEFLEFKRQYRVAHNESIFGFCFRAIIDRLLNDVVLKDLLSIGCTLSFVLESGDANGDKSNASLP